jgi:hypothetical protein
MTLQLEFCLHTTSVQIQISNTWMSTKVGTLRAQHSTPVPSLAPTVMSEEKITYFKCWPGTLTIQNVHKKCTKGVLNLNWVSSGCVAGPGCCNREFATYVGFSLHRSKSKKCQFHKYQKITRKAPSTRRGTEWQGGGDVTIEEGEFLVCVLIDGSDCVHVHSAWKTDSQCVIKTCTNCVQRICCAHTKKTPCTGGVLIM